MKPAGDATIPGFEVLAKLSSGGMGQVLLARRRGAHGFEKLIAVKTIRNDLEERDDIRVMFLDEARLAARLQHPAITQVYDFGEAEGTLFLAMEYVAGVPFHHLIREQGRVPPLVAARLIAEVCRGLHSAHELADLDGRPLGVVHRDISPQNLLLTFEGRVKILDFGIAFARDREAPVTELGVIRGKPSYLAPEQFSHQPVDRRTDVYSVSVVLYELLTGKKLYDRGTIVQLAMAIQQEHPPPPSAIAGSLPAGLDAIVMRGLEKSPEQRFESARAMADALESVINQGAGESVESFAEQNLAEERESHRRRLLGMTDAAEPSPPGRDRATLTGALLPAPVIVDGLAPTMISPKRARRSFAIAIALAGLLAATAALFALRPAAEPLAEPAKALLEAPAPKEIDLAPVAPIEPPPTATRAESHPRQSTHRPRPKREESSAPAPVGRAYLSIGARPYAMIRLDDVEIGATPVINLEIAAGTHQLLLIRPDTQEVVLRQTLQLQAGEHKKITLRP